MQVIFGVVPGVGLGVHVVGSCSASIGNGVARCAKTGVSICSVVVGVQRRRATIRIVCGEKRKEERRRMKKERKGALVTRAQR